MASRSRLVSSGLTETASAKASRLIGSTAQSIQDNALFTRRRFSLLLALALSSIRSYVVGKSGGNVSRALRRDLSAFRAHIWSIWQATQRNLSLIQYKDLL